MNIGHTLTLSDKFKALLIDWGFSNRIASYVSEFLGLFIVLVASVITYQALKFIINRFLRRLVLRSKSRWDDYLYENKVFTRLALIVPAIIINAFLPATIAQYPKLIHIFGVILQVYSALVMILVANSFLTAVYHIYGDFEVANSKPIKGYVQILKIFVFIIGGIVIISMLIGQSPLNLLAGLGAMSAVLLLVFKDSILGFVAGVQISNNNMMMIGDWVTLPKHGADGIVVDISLVTVKIRNFDNSVVTIPTYTFVSDPVFNWRSMMDLGGRRIKRSFLLDITSVKAVDDELKLKLKGLEIPDYAWSGDPVMITNLSVFRHYLTNYLKTNESINQQNTVAVRLLQPSENGLPVEIMAFSMIADFVDFENFQSVLFEHVFAVLPVFGLKILQRPMLVLPAGTDEKNS